MSDELRIWECEIGSGHVLGIVKRERSHSYLLLYRHAVDSGSEHPAEVDIMGIIHSAEEIRCEICGQIRTWAPNQEALERLMGRYKRERAQGPAPLRIEIND